MTALKIKNELMRIISDTDDVEKLLRIKNTAEAVQQQDNELTEEQLRLIKKSEEDIREGKVYTHEQARARIDVFIQKKIQEAK